MAEQFLQGGAEISKAHGLGDAGRAIMFAKLNVIVVGRSGKDSHGDLVPFIVVSNMLQRFTAIHFRHIHIDHNEGGEGLAFLFQLVQDLYARFAALSLVQRNLRI